MSLNADLIRARCAEIEESIVRLEEFQALSVEAFLSNRDALDVASYRLLSRLKRRLRSAITCPQDVFGKFLKSMQRVSGYSMKPD